MLCTVLALVVVFVDGAFVNVASSSCCFQLLLLTVVVVVVAVVVVAEVLSSC